MIFYKPGASKRISYPINHSPNLLNFEFLLLNLITIFAPTINKSI